MAPAPTGNTLVLGSEPTIRPTKITSRMNRTTADSDKMYPVPETTTSLMERQELGRTGDVPTLLSGIRKMKHAGTVSVFKAASALKPHKLMGPEVRKHCCPSSALLN